MSLLLLFNQPSGGGGQTLTASLFTDGDTFNAHTLAASITLTASLFTDDDTFFTHTLVQAGGGQTLLPSLFADGDTFFSHTLAVGAVTLSPSLFANDNVFYLHTLTGGAVAQQPQLPPTLGGGGAPIWSEVAWFKKKKKPKKAELVKDVADVVEQAVPALTTDESLTVARRILAQIDYEQLRRIETIEAFIARVEAEVAEMDDEEVLLLAA